MIFLASVLVIPLNRGLEKKLIKELELEAQAHHQVELILKDIAIKAQDQDEEQLAQFLENEKWYPAMKVTDQEFRAATILNILLDEIIEKVNNNFQE